MKLVTTPRARNFQSCELVSGSSCSGMRAGLTSAWELPMAKCMVRYRVASVSFILVAERFWSEPDQERPPAHVARSDCLEGTMRLAVAICGLMLLIGGAHVLGRGRA